MVFPSSPLIAFLLLLVSVFCLGLWPILFQGSSSRYRFEIFSFDFALGAVLFSLVAAYTFGTMGADLSFSDSMLVAGRRAQAMALSAGALFALGNMLLLCTISLIGLSRAALLSFSLAAALLCGLSANRFNYVTAIAGLFLLLICVLCGLLATLDPKTNRPPAAPSRLAGYGYGGKHGKAGKSLSDGAKGAITAIISGLCLGGVVPIIRLAEPDELGIGPYGGLLMACLGILVTTPLLNFYFMNLAIEGGSLGVRAYLQGPARRRIASVAAGAIWAIGALSLYVVVANPGPFAIAPSLEWSAPLAAVVVTVLCGVLGVGSGKVLFAPKARNFVYSGLAIFVLGALALMASVSPHSK